MIEYDDVDFAGELGALLDIVGESGKPAAGDDLRLLQDSFQYEHDTGSPEQYERIRAYVREHDVPRLSELHQLIAPGKQFLRDKIVFINPLLGYESAQCSHVGVDHTAINEEMLQNFVDYFYRNRKALPFYMGRITCSTSGCTRRRTGTEDLAA